MSDKESIKGATTRAKKAIKKEGADYGVGLEGGLQKIGSRWFDCGWIAVVDKKGRVGIASSVRVVTPPKMIRGGLELGDVNDIIFNKKNSKQAEGHFGLMTKNLLTRERGYKDAVIMALVRFNHPKIFDD